MSYRFSERNGDEAPVVRSVSDKVEEDNNMEYGRDIWVNVISFKTFAKDSMIDSDYFLQHCYYVCLAPWITAKFEEYLGEEKNDWKSDTDKKRLGAPYLYLSIATDDETNSRNYSETKQVFKYDQALLCKRAIPTPDNCDVRSGAQRNDDARISTVNERNFSEETDPLCKAGI